MDLSAINPVLLIASLMVAATPLLLAAIGEVVVEKAGVLNLGVEGMMITGAICGFAIAVETGSPVVGFVAAAIGGALLSVLFAILTQFALANQVASGLALTLFGLGLSALLAWPCRPGHADLPTWPCRPGHAAIGPPKYGKFDKFGLAGRD